LAKEALDLAYEVAEHVENTNQDAIEKRVPDRQDRMMLLRSLEQLSPRTIEAYHLTFANGSPAHAGVRLTGVSRGKAQSLIFRELGEESANGEEARVVGTLTKIHFDTAPQFLSVRGSAGQEVNCYYDESLRDQVSNLCAGSIVEVFGFGSLSTGGRVKRLDYVTSIDSVSMEPIRIARFEHGGRIYKLSDAVPFNIEFSEGVWAYSNEALGIRSYAGRREDALHELHEAFDFAYRDIALENDDGLIGDAIKMKRELLRLVQTSPVEGNP